MVFIKDDLQIIYEQERYRKYSYQLSDNVSVYLRCTLIDDNKKELWKCALGLNIINRGDDEFESFNIKKSDMNINTIINVFKRKIPVIERKYIKHIFEGVGT